MPSEGTTDAPRSPSIGFGWLDAPAPVGRLYVGWVAEGIAILSFEAPGADTVARFAPELEAAVPGEVPRAYASALRRYFEGERLDPALLPVRLGGTDFQRRVWEALRRVPRGRVRTYAGLAEDALSPRATRAVGAAMAANPIAIVVPCHRVVAKGYHLGGYSGGLERKRALLAVEGVTVEGDRVLPGQLSLV